MTVQLPDPIVRSDIQFLLQHLTETQQAAILWFRANGVNDVNSGGSRGPASDTVRELLNFTVGDPRTELARTVRLIEDADDVRPTSRTDRWMRLTPIGLEVRKSLVLNVTQ